MPPKEDELNIDFLEEGTTGDDPVDDDNPDDGTGDVKPGEEDPSKDAGDEEIDAKDSAASEPKKGGVQKRIDRLTREKYDLERDNIYLRGQLSQVKKSGEPKDDIPAELSRDDFKTDDAYFKALNAQNLEILRKEREGETQKQQDERKQEEQEALKRQLDSGREKYKDFDSVALADDHKVTQEMYDAAHGEHLEDILYVLGKNPAASNRIASLSASQQIKEIGKIEARIEKVKGTKPKPKIPEDEPITTLKTSGAASNIDKDISKMSMKQRMAHWDEQRETKLKKNAGLA